MNAERGFRKSFQLGVAGFAIPIAIFGAIGAIVFLFQRFASDGSTSGHQASFW